MRGWTPARRERARERARAYWDSPAGLAQREKLRGNWMQRYGSPQERWAKFKAEHPDRAKLAEDTRAAIRDGRLVPKPCNQRCGRQGEPVYDWTMLEVVGWKCYECRRAGRSRDNKNQGGDGSTAVSVRGVSPATGTPYGVEGVLRVSRDRPAPTGSHAVAGSTREEKNV